MVVVIASMLMIIVSGEGVLNNSSILLPMADAQKPQHAEFGSIQNDPISICYYGSVT